VGLYDDMVAEVSVAPALLDDGTSNGTAIDRGVNGGMQSAVLLVVTGTVTDGSHAVTIEDSADGSTGWAAVNASQLQGSLPTVVAANDNTLFEVGVRSTKRYLRAVVTTSGATTGGLIGAYVLLASPRFAPVSH
jgi:hypothetical protein